MPDRYVVTVMITDSWKDEMPTNIILAMSAEWMWGLFYCAFIILSLLSVISTVLALAQYQDSVRSSNRVRFIWDVCREYNMKFSAKHTKTKVLTSCQGEVVSSDV